MPLRVRAVLQPTVARISCIFGYVRTVTIGTHARCRLVEKYKIAINRLFIYMARRTADILVPALERETSLLMIKERWFPLRAVVTRGAIARLRSKLVRMRILMAITAAHGRLAEFNMKHRMFHVRRPVAIDAYNRSMRAFQNKFRFCVIKLGKIAPLLRRVTHLASCRFSLRVECLHPIGKLSMMNIIMTTRATQI